MTDELKPGFASEEPDTDERPIFEEGRTALAHYAKMSDVEAQEYWNHHTLCVRCMTSPMCKVASGTGEALVLIERCLAYVPAPK